MTVMRQLQLNLMIVLRNGGTVHLCLGTRTKTAQVNPEIYKHVYYFGLTPYRWAQATPSIDSYIQLICLLCEVCVLLNKILSHLIFLL